MFLAAFASLTMTFWQVSVQESTGETSPDQGVVCAFRPTKYSLGSVTYTCKWNIANSAVRGLAGFLTLLLFLIILLKISSPFRTERKIVYILLVLLSWLGSTSWLVLAIWDGNEVRKSHDQCKAITTARCDYARFVGTVICDIGLWVIGWVLSIVFSVWSHKNDFKRAAGLCGRPRRKRRGANNDIPLPSAPPEGF